MKSRFFVFAAALLLAAVSCKKEGTEPVDGLSAPELKLVTKTSTSFEVLWAPVEGASSYGYEFEGEDGNTLETSLSFTELESGRVYTLKVRALSETDKSDWDEISVELEPDGQEPGTDVEFNLEVRSEGTDIIVKTAPSDKEFPYYFEPIPESMFAAAGSDAEAFFRQMMSDYMGYFGSAEAAFGKLAKTGDKELKYDVAKYAEEKFVVLLAGIDNSLEVTTAVESAEVTVELPSSDNEFVINILDLEQTSFIVNVIPSNDDQYAIVLQDTKTVDSMNETQLKSFLSGLVGENSICTGETDMLYEKNIVPSHDYSVFVFGWDETFTTELTRKDFRTPDPEEVDVLTFELTADVTGPESADCKVVPSNEKASYFYDVIAMEDWNGKYGTDPRNYIEDMAVQKNWTIIKYLTLFGSVGTQEYTYGDSYLKPGSEYVLFAIGYQIEGDQVTYLEPQHITFSTPAQ